MKSLLQLILSLFSNEIVIGGGDRKVKCTVLANDILTTSYYDQENCAITLALKRAGLDAKDTGMGIRIWKDHSHYLIVKNVNLLNRKIMSMYHHPSTSWKRVRLSHRCTIPIQEPKDFVFYIKV